MRRGGTRPALFARYCAARFLRQPQRSIIVMPGLVPGIHFFLRLKYVDGRDKPGHDGVGCEPISLS
jgi:hypothetical protein